MANSVPLPVRNESSPEEKKVQSSYERSMILSRVLLGAFFFCVVAFLLWSIPWLRIGTSRAEYNSHVVFQTLLSGVLVVLAFASIRLRDRTRNTAVSIMSWTAVKDKLAHMRRHEYFIDRLLFECDKARRSGMGFAVYVVRLVPPASSFPDLSRIHRVLALLEPLSAEYDWLAAIGNDEAGMLMPGMRPAEAPAFAERLREQVRAEMAKEGVGVRVGWAIFGDEDVITPVDLLTRARASVARVEAPAA